MVVAKVVVRRVVVVARMLVVALAHRVVHILEVVVGVDVAHEALFAAATFRLSNWYR